jgi:hypothetical protein
MLLIFGVSPYRFVNKRTGEKIVVADQIYRGRSDAFFSPAKIVKTTKTQISLPCFSYCNRGKVKES